MIKCRHSLPETPKEDVKPEIVCTWCSFNIPEVRDLAWLLFSPRLVASYREFSSLQLIHDAQAATAWLNQLDHSLGKPLPKRSDFKRLGLYFEALISTLLNDQTSLPWVNHQLLNAHLQVYTPSNTLGEVDFILQNKWGQKAHLEATVKFYLQTRLDNQACDSQARWVGPNANDRLEIKFNKLFFKQLPLSGHPNFIEQYPDYRHIQQRSHLFCGRLFHHWADSAVTPQALNPSCLRGHWVTQTEFATLLRTQNYRFTPLHKLAWLGGNSSFHNADQHDNFENQALDKNHQEKSTCTENTINTEDKNRAHCYIRYAKWGDTELGQVMVVPDAWPKTQA